MLYGLLNHWRQQSLSTLKLSTASHVRGEEMLQGSEKGGNGMGPHHIYKRAATCSFWSWDMIAKACLVVGTVYLAYGKAHIMHSTYHDPLLQSPPLSLSPSFTTFSLKASGMRPGLADFARPWRWPSRLALPSRQFSPLST